MTAGNPLLGFLRSHRLTKRLAYQTLLPRSRGVVKNILPYLHGEGATLDIGCGSCNVVDLLLNHGLRIVPLDIWNTSFVSSISPTVYDGYRMPFRDNQFSTSLLLFVLHHASDPIKLLVEAMRVSRRLLVFEDIVTSRAHKHLTAILDSIMNLEFKDQPHFNKRDAEWNQTFWQLGLRIVKCEYRTFGLALKQALYVLET
jgi:SAM-dependent methyltransferase